MKPSDCEPTADLSALARDASDMGDFALARHLRKQANELHNTLAKSDPKIARGLVWCAVCGHTRRVDPAACLRSGWPEHCGQTMTIDSAEERGRG